VTARETFLLQRVQPALTGLIDGSLSTIAPIFAVALYTHKPHAAITGLGTFAGGILHTLPFLIPQYRVALIFAAAVVAFELVALAWLRWRFFKTSFVSSLAYVTLAGIVIGAVSATLGATG
jgi:hypothetical protein